MNKKNKGFTTIELITSFILASVIMIILFNIILILKDNLSKVNAKTNMLVEKDNLSYNINKKFKEKELSSITMCDEGDKCYEFKYSDDTSDKLVYSNTDKSITFNNYTFDIIDGITVEEPTITEHYDTMSSTKYNGYFIIHIPIKLDDKDYSIKINKHFNTDSVMVDLTNYQYDTNGNKYTPVEYLESTGTQYIDTGIIPEYGLEANLVISFTTIVSDSCIIGSTIGNERTFISLYQTYGFSFGATGYYNDTGGLINDEIYILKANWIYGDSTLYVNNTQIATVRNTNMLVNKYPMTLFCRNTNGTKERCSQIKMYSYSMLLNNEIIQDFIPVIDSTDRPCMFDKVEKKCYYNQGTGEFLYG